MKSIGGFFDIEIPKGSNELHKRASALTNGRACMALWINQEKPSHVYVPYYCCDALFEPLQNANIPITFYSIDSSLKEYGLPANPRPGEWMVWTNFFGLIGERVQSIAERWFNRVLVDNTHSFFDAQVDNLWSFTSARKYFGVPDGAYCYSPSGKIDVSHFNRFVPSSASHLIARYTTMKDRAYDQYREAEDAMGSEIKRISKLSEQIISSVDVKKIEGRRALNLSILNRELGGYNSFCLSAEIDQYSAFCYPFLPDRKISRERLYEEGVFIPTLWADTCRRGVKDFKFEQEFSQNLLPLPVDHRYDSHDMLRMANLLKGCLS